MKTEFSINREISFGSNKLEFADEVEIICEFSVKLIISGAYWFPEIDEADFLICPVTGDFSHKGQWRGALMFSLIRAWINGQVNNREAGDLWRHRTHYCREVSFARSRKSLATLTLGSSKINQHCWRFHGSGVIAAPQIIGLISFCTGMHHEYFFRSSMCFRVPHLCSKIPKINNWTGEFAIVIWRLHCFTVSFRGDVRGESGPR